MSRKLGDDQQQIDSLTKRIKSNDADIDKKKIVDADDENDDADADFNEIDCCEQEGDEEEEELVRKEVVNIEFTYGLLRRLCESNQRFNGHLKRFPFDFVVNEIDLDGNVVRLSSFDEPIEPNVEKETEETEAANSIHETIESQECNNFEAIISILGEDKFKELKEFLDAEEKSKSFKLDAPSIK